MKKIIVSTLIVSVLAIAGGDIAPVTEEIEVAPVVTEKNNGLQQRILVYGWLPNVDGTLNYDIPGSDEDASADASDIIDALEMVFMGTYEARKDKWSFKADAIYLKLGNSEQNAVSVPVGPGDPNLEVAADQSMTAWLLGFYGGYNTIETNNLTLDVMAGARYFSLDVSADLQIDGPLPPSIPSANLAQSVELWDAVVGIKGAYRVNENWFLPYHFDIGAGDSDLTWQALAGVGYRYGWGDLLLVYRHLGYDQGDTELVQNLEFSGPAIAVNFHF